MESVTRALFNCQYCAVASDVHEWHEIAAWLLKRSNEQTELGPLGGSFRAQMAWRGCCVAYALEYMSYDLPSFCGITEEHAVHFRWCDGDRLLLLAVNHGWFADLYLSENDVIRHCAISFRE